ncbi:uncharacterized mitochondrial hydrolase Fmp41p [[Candida] jaroonii]|uniref:Uncharacterized mitochondrial hydrolase Fmp41p n=1 Tax=[Candida] jaroonii TaxID=467808 RepID=A0ACA9Y5D9_9ASCO|nr:uncharacterized mitochondrial hydrolase Fmp41p [[Candida] jaroonii]
MSLKYIENSRKILCIGRNYAAHIKELGNARPKRPMFFMKPPTSILKPGEGPLLIPKGVSAHYEVELAFILNKDLKHLPTTFSKQDAIDSIEGYALAIDMTARNVQNEAKAKGLPWTLVKGFDTFLPLSGLIPKSKIPDPYNVNLKLSVDGQVKQDDKTDLMIFPIEEILVHMSSIMTLQKGDLILTGTPKGVGPVQPGETLDASLSVDGEILESISVKAEESASPYFFEES